MHDFQALAYCGIDCGICKNYNTNMNCKGCKNETELISDCSTRICAISRGLLHCGDCKEFPCEELNSFYHDGNEFHLQAYKNMQSIIENGAHACKN